MMNTYDGKNIKTNYFFNIEIKEFTFNMSHPILVI